MRTIKFIAIVLVLVLFSARVAQAQEPRKIEKLKELCIDTLIAAGGKPAAVIVAPPGEQYADAVATIQDAVSKCSKVSLSVRRDSPNPEEILKEQNVIALGNMATNPFVEHMYRQWYVILDLKYPGKGGYAVRSLHNPYATGRNVIWIGGSDDEGVREAAQVFAALLKPGDPLKVGWLMEIRLGEGMTPPTISPDAPRWTVYSWRDSWRRVGDKTIGYAPSTFFGWNPISIAGVLYYMTGEKQYLDCFKALAMPDPNNIPAPNRTDDAFDDPMNPLVKNYHYRAHLVDCVFDLIEESPLFTDAERLFITNKLVEHQNFFDPKDDYPKPNVSRHGMWHMLCIYTGSRYLAKYYPSPQWDKRMENVRKAFYGWIGNPTWGEMDTLSWVSTSTEPVFEFFMLDGFKDFVESGTARTMISAAETLWSGKKIEESNSCLTINLLHKAAYMLQDGRYAWLARQLGFDFDVFRIGQSFWPPPALKIEPPTDLVGRISLYPLPKTYWEWTGRSIPIEQSFQILSYRSGLTEQDDFFQIDGFYGRGRNPYHVNPLYVLRMNGQTLLSGYSSQLSVRRNGMVENKVAMAAALKSAAALDGAAYVRTQVPDMPFSAWDRHVLYLGGDYLFVLDEITPRQPGIFEVAAGWDLLGSPKKGEDAPRCVTTTSGVALHCARPMDIAFHGRTAHQRWTGELKDGEMFVLGNIIFSTHDDNNRSYTIDAVAKRAHLIRGSKTAFVGVGEFDSDALSVKAEIASVSADKIFLANGVELKCGSRVVAQCDKPVSLLWHLGDGMLCVQAKDACQLRLLAAEKTPIELKPGQHKLEGIQPDPGLAEAVAASLGAMSNMVEVEAAVAVKAEEIKADWQPQWQTKLDGAVTQIAAASHSDPQDIWVITEDKKVVEDGKRAKPFGRLSLLSPDGKIRKGTEYDAPMLSLWTAADKEQAESFAALVGFPDDMLRAFSASGEEIWKCEAAIHPSFKIGDRYQAPWFTDPRPPYDHRGIFSILVGDFWGKGTPEIATGRPCTVEFRDFKGKLIERVPTQWGDNTSLALLDKPGKDGEKERPRWLLVGKFHTGSPGVSVIGEDHKVASNGLYSANEKGTAYMSAWMQRGLSHMITSDVDNDGVQEVIIALSGHWNQINLYKGGDWSQCLWTRCFGPARSRSRFIQSVVVADITGSGTKEIIVGMENGWVCAFDKEGTPLWQKRFPSGVMSMCAPGEPSRLVVGCGDGALYLLGARGETLHTAALGAGIAAVATDGQRLLAGTDAGEVAAFRLPD